MIYIEDRMLLWTAVGKAVVVEPLDVYWIEADADASWVRLKGRDRVRDHRSLGELAQALESFGFLRIHRNHAINLHRVAEIRRRRPGADWEVKLEPPVNRVLPVARGQEHALLAAFGGG